MTLPASPDGDTTSLAPPDGSLDPAAIAPPPPTPPGVAVVSSLVKPARHWRSWTVTSGQRVLLLLAVCLLLTTTAIALFVMVTSLRTNTTTLHASTVRADSNAVLIDDLSKQVTELNSVILAGRVATAARLACDAQFADAAEFAYRNFVAKALNLAAPELPTDPPKSPEALDAELRQAHADVDLADTTWRAVAQQQSAYIAGGRPLPCPLAGFQPPVDAPPVPPQTP